MKKLYLTQARTLQARLRLLLCSFAMLFFIAPALAQSTLFNESFTSGSFTTNGWTFPTTAGNWVVGSNWVPTGATAPSATFNYSPVYTNYSFSLVSPVIPASGYVNKTLSYKLYLNNYSTSTLEQFSVEYKKTSSATWTLLTNYTNGAGSFNVSPANVPLTGTDTADIQLRFTIYGANSYNLNGWGLDDILVDGIPASACSGTPTAGTVSGPTAVCPNTTFNLGLVGFTQASGLNYQWQKYNTATSTWDPIPSATNPTYTVTGGIAAATDFRAMITCTNGGASDISPALTITTNPFNTCYCSPLTGNPLHSSPWNYINNVTIVGTTLNSSNTTTPSNGYLQLSPTTASNTATLTQGVQYTLSVTNTYSGTYYIPGVWIDYNQSGTFDAGEMIAMTTSGSTSTGTFTVPITATPGMTGFRVREYYTSFSSTQACYNPGDGETEDYQITIAAAVPCAGTPNATTISGPAAVCSGANYTLTASGYSTGLGITYQWEKYDAATSSWIAVSGATNPTYVVTGGQTTANDYRFITTCTNGGATDISNTITVTMNQFYLCYCSPLTGVTLHSYSWNYINNVTIAGTTLNSTNNTTPSNGYLQLSPATASNTASLTQGVQYTLTVTNVYSGNYMPGVWLDFNQSGTFDVGELVTMTTSGTTSTGTFIVPITATPGLTGLRVREYWTSFSGTQACYDPYDGETEDYLVTIVAAVPCAGTPNTTTITGPASVCASSNFTLSASGFSTGLGITYQWEKYDVVSSSWIPVLGATNPTYTVTGGQTVASDYRFITTCTNGGATDISNTLNVTMNQFYLCYCSPLTGVTLHSYSWNYINNVTIGGTTLNSSNTTTPVNGYLQLSPTTASNTASLTQGVQYTLTVTNNGTYTPGVWIDFNQSGTFDATELVTMTTSGSTSTGTFIVPITATPGLTGFRVREYYSTFSGTQACYDPYDGETEDYLVTIVTALPCAGTPSATTISGPSAVCSGVSYTLNASGFSTGLGITYQWEKYDAVTSSWQPVVGASNPSYTVTGGQTTANNYRFITTCSNGGGTNTSNTLTVTMNPFYNCYCTATNQGGSQITNVTIVGTTFNNTSGTAPAPTYYNSFTPTGGATATLIQGTNYTMNTTFDASAISSVWIDYNQDGSYSATEWAQLGTTGTTGTATLAVPLTATLGQTGMRVRSRASGNQNGAGDACLAMGSGETEDYVITIGAAVNCTGTPVAGTASGPAGACTGVAFSLSLSGYTVGSGITISWESRPVGSSTWVPMGQTNATVTGVTQTTATEYHAVVTCATTPASTSSNTVTVLQNAITQCYCQPTVTTQDELISNVTVANISNPSTGFGVQGYQDFTNLTANMTIGTAYSFSATIAPFYNSDVVAVWIDLDQDGVFANPAERLYLNTPAASPSTGTITIPATALTGTTRMRVRLDYSNVNPSPCGNTAYGNTEDYTVVISTASSCPAPTGLSATNTGSGTADLGWNIVTGAIGYEYAITTSSTPPASGTYVTPNTVTGATYTTGSQSYYVHVRTDCGSGFSPWSTTSFIVNNSAGGSMLLTVGGTCTGSPYTNAGGSQATGEPSPTCAGAGGFNTIWFRFVAPASGAVKITNDFATGTIGTDTRLALYTATNVNDYTTFSILSCDDDNGATSATKSIIYAAGLTSGTTYYIQVDGYDASNAVGTFCLEVHELSSTMVATSGSCAAAQSFTINAGYTGGSSLVNTTGQVIATVKNNTTGAAAMTYGSAVTKNTGAVRTAGNQYYLDRNYLINNGGVAGSFDVTLFFLGTEQTALQAVDPLATLTGLNVTRQTGTTCQANYAVANGTNSALIQTGSGSVNLANWIKVTSPGFSNFYIMSGANPLAIKLGDIFATNVGARNRVDWRSETEMTGDKYQVERSADGRNFTYMGTVNAKGQASVYSYWDETPVTGVNHYRLKMIDAAGNTAYSKVVTANVKSGSFTVEAYPNPVSEILTVKVYGAAASNPVVTISDATGKIVKMVSVKNNEAIINMSSLAQGMYLVKYSDNNHTQTIKVNKQ
jgi:hypothetical protein